MRLNKTVLFVVSSGIKIGLGHLKRCNLLAKEFRKSGLNCVVYINNKDFIKFLKKNYFNKIYYHKKLSLNLLKSIKDLKISYAVLDTIINNNLFEFL